MDLEKSNNLIQGVISTLIPCEQISASLNYTISSKWDKKFYKSG